MLPNWLYGKSLKKLQEIFSDGSTPPDYNEVKAQVAQNTTEISSVKQALANNVNQNGCKNMLDVGARYRTGTMDSKVTVVDDVITVNGTQTDGGSYRLCPAENDNSYVLPAGTYIIVGERSDTNITITLRKNGVDFYASVDPSTPREFTANGTDYFQVLIRLAAGEYSNATIKLMICLKSDYDLDPSYAPYAMTNQEITSLLTADANLGTALNLSTYTSYSNLYTAPSDGYVHFLSAASGSAARTIYTYGNNTTAATDPHFTHSTSANNKAFEIFIKKGLKLYVDGLQSGDTINFYPLS